jgi:hypothetical protein
MSRDISVKFEFQKETETTDFFLLNVGFIFWFFFIVYQESRLARTGAVRRQAVSNAQLSFSPPPSRVEAGLNTESFPASLARGKRRTIFFVTHLKLAGTVFFFFFFKPNFVCLSVRLSSVAGLIGTLIVADLDWAA